MKKISTALQTRAKALRNRDESEKGFTLIELLVVVAILAILAAVAIPLYLSSQDDARDAAVKTALSSVVSEASANAASSGTSPDYSAAAKNQYPTSSVDSVWVTTDGVTDGVAKGGYGTHSNTWTIDKSGKLSKVK